MKELSRFHLKDGIYFSRMEDNSVRIQKMGEGAKGEEVSEEMIIDEHGWASIVSSVSQGGEVDNGYYKALEFHNEEKHTNQ